MGPEKSCCSPIKVKKKKHKRTMEMYFLQFWRLGSSRSSERTFEDFVFAPDCLIKDPLVSLTTEPVFSMIIY